MVQDKKAIQAGTSHYLGQNFSKAQDITFLDKNNDKKYAHTTSWGVSTRLIGTLIMAHSDDDGLVLPPRVAPQQVVIIPVIPKEEGKEAIMESCHSLAEALRLKVKYAGSPIKVHVDTRDIHGGTKKWDWIKKGVPLRVEIGPKDLETRKVCLTRRDKAPNEKAFISRADFLLEASGLLDEIQESILAKATELRDSNIIECSELTEFESHWGDFEKTQPKWLLSPWGGTVEEEETLSKKHKISIRCIPQEMQKGPSVCILTGRNTSQWVLWARSY